jgi:tetratricopeptide (TPR) repeat protein
MRASPRNLDATLASPDGERGDHELPLHRGATVGRYVLLEQLGAGAMGVVYSAYDPELDRKLALKILRGGRDSAATHDRLRREAQALARLSHANVVTVHDVGTHGGRVFVAMEFVAGETLRAWMTRGPHPVDEVLRVFAAAGRGLAAAHQAGLVHRDFKPENVLLGKDGSVRVVDFGLARRADDLEPARVEDDPVSTLDDEPEKVLVSRSLQLSLTRTGGVMGTPAYMSPEQHLGLRATARSDQFAFAVALWEALRGERPFPGRDMASLSLSVTEGRLRAIPSEGPYANHAVSGHLHRVLVRALATTPEHRFDDMDALLAALAHDPDRRRKRILKLVGINLAAALLLFGAGVVVAERFAAGESTSATLCEVSHELDGAWDEARRAAVHERFAASKAPFAAHAGRQLQRRLDAYATQWFAAWRTTCETERTVGRSGELELQRECLAERRRELAGFVDALLAASEDSDKRLERALAGAEALPPIASCTDIARLRESGTQPEQRERVTELAAALGEARTLGALGNPSAGLARAREVEAEARTLGHPRTHIRALLLIVGLQRDAKDIDAALVVAREAYVEAERVGEDWLRVEAALELFGMLAFDLDRPAEAAVWSEVADALIERLGDPDDLRGRWWMHRGGLHSRAAEHAQAEGALTQAKQVLERSFGPDAAELDPVLSRLGNTMRDQGDYASAIAHHRHVLERRRLAYGPDHPDVATAWATLAVDAYYQGHYEESLGYSDESLRIVAACYGEDSPVYALRLNNHAATLEKLGRLDEAEAIHRKLLAVNTARFGAEDVRVATSLGNLALVLLSDNRAREAAELYEQALALRLAAHGPDHLATATAETNLASALVVVGELARARELLEHALATHVAKLGPDHRDLADVHATLGALELAEQHYAAAREHYGHVLALDEAALGEDAPELADTLTSLAEIALAEGNDADALALAERALDLRNAPTWLAPGRLASTRFMLAQALARRDGPDDRTRANDLASLARGEFERAGMRDELARVDAWLER